MELKRAVASPMLVGEARVSFYPHVPKDHVVCFPFLREMNFLHLFFESGGLCLHVKLLPMTRLNPSSIGTGFSHFLIEHF